MTRSVVPQKDHYLEYRQYLRRDFHFSCGHCTMSEAEAHGVAFAIDHYEPRNARRDLEHDYRNLIYSCQVCNGYKGDLCPPLDARSKGHRFFRPDQDDYEEHFRDGVHLTSKTNVGDFSIETLYLNRKALRDLRELRKQLTEAATLVSEGVLELREFGIDQLPPNVRALAIVAIRGAEETADEFAEAIDSLLRRFARSFLLDQDPKAEAEAKRRAVEAQKLRGLFPCTWRVRQQSAPRRRSR